VKSSCTLHLSSTAVSRRSRYPAFLAGILFLVGSMHAQDSGLQARQVYYKPQGAPKVDQNSTSDPKQTETPVKNTTKRTQAKKTTTSNDHVLTIAPAPLGLKYVMEQVQPTGSASQVDPDKVFKTGDGIRLRVEVNSDAYVYLLTQESSGEWKVLFPEAGEDNHLKAFHSVEVPAASTDPIVFSEPAGSENLYIRVSRTPIDNLQKLIPTGGEQGQKMPTVPKSQMDDLQKTERMQGRDLTRGKVAPADGPAPGDQTEWAFYVVNNSSSPSAQVIQKFQLRHK